MNTIKPLNIFSLKSKPVFIGFTAICVLFCLGCQERQVGIATKSSAIEPVKTVAKSKGGEFRTSHLSDNAFAITPTSEFKINVEYPWKMAALDPAIKVGEIKLDENKATISVELPKEMVDQKKDVTIKGSFSVCNDEKCLIYRDEELTLKQTP